MSSANEALATLRALNRDPRPGADLGTRGRAQLIDTLGGGWASRRALSRMLETRSLDGVDEALELIRRLSRPGQRVWCLADLLEHWTLDAVQIDEILDAAPTDGARRRLSRRRVLGR